MSRAPLAIAGAIVLAGSVAAFAAENDLAKCRAIKDDKARLACFDDLRPVKAGASGSYLERAWKLAAEDKRIGIDELQPYRPIYIVLGKHTDNVNTQPTSPSPDHTVPAPIPWNSDEMMVQLSFKSELMSRQDFGRKILGLENVRLWFAYTQRAFWQIYNAGLSRPFRENTYEPEAIFTFGTGNGADGWKLLNLGFVHQSNGRPLPQSRSWYRLYAQGGWEWGPVSLLARAWWRVPEKPEKDDNPDIQSYLGRGDIQLRWNLENDKSVTVLARRALDSGHGFIEAAWTSRKLFGPARVYVQATSGYGESLIDYNFRQNTIGVGFAYSDW